MPHKADGLVLTAEQVAEEERAQYIDSNKLAMLRFFCEQATINVFRNSGHSGICRGLPLQGECKGGLHIF